MGPKGLASLVGLALWTTQAEAFGSRGLTVRDRGRRWAQPPAEGEEVEAYIEMLEGLPEEDVPEVQLTRSRDGSTGTASFTFRRPLVLLDTKKLLVDEQRVVLGVRLVDAEGLIECDDVEAVFEQGRPTALVATHIMRSEEEWDRLLRFMDRYARTEGLAFSGDVKTSEGDQ